jgi:hypothetical protein
MARASIISTRLAQLLLLAVLAFNVWKAASVPITTDEAMSYNDFVADSLEKFLGSYDANHHVLHNYLCRFTVRWLGTSEFSLRVPSLLAGALYLFLVYQLSRRVFGSGLLFLASVALLATNPFVLDYLSLARGYSLALALWMLALYWMFTRPTALYRIAIALALAVSANLAFVFPALALVAAFSAIAFSEGRRPFELIEQLYVPIVVIAFVILVLPLSKARPDNFYYGSKSLRQTLDWFLASSFLWAAAFTRPTKHFAALKEIDQFLLLAGGTALFTLTGLMAAHHIAGVPYPLGRTGIYWVPLVTLLVMALVKRWPLLQVPTLVLALLCVVQYVYQWNPRYYREWSSDAALVRIANSIRQSQPHQAHIKIRAASTLYQGLNFYRRKNRWRDWDEVQLDATKGPADFRVLLPTDTSLVQSLQLKVIYRDEPTGIVVAR